MHLQQKGARLLNKHDDAKGDEQNDCKPLPAFFSRLYGLFEPVEKCGDATYGTEGCIRTSPLYLRVFVWICKCMALKLVFRVALPICFDTQMRDSIFIEI